jgi:chromosome partitioning protein
VTRCIAFHSYKGGTGKTTIASNLASMLAAKGYKVALLDFDVYAPSMQAYFDYMPRKWINDMLSDNAEVKDVMIDTTGVVQKYANDSMNKDGRLWVGYSNSKKEEVYKLEGDAGKPGAKLQILRKFMHLREELISEFESDFIIIDTSPGIRYWSINSLAIADTLFLTLKFGDLDIEGTKKMASDMYGSFTRFGAKSYLLLNRVAGYCIPHSVGPGHAIASDMKQNDDLDVLSREVGMELISAIPCYCDIQFKRKEFLTVLEYPEHPFAKQLEQLAANDQIKV